MNKKSINARIYLNAMKWMDSVGIIRASPVLDEKKIYDEMLSKQCIITPGTRKDNVEVLVVVVSTDNDFKNKKNVDNVTSRFDMTGKYQITIISKITHKGLNKSKFIRNVTHGWFLMDPREHVNVAKYTIIENKKDVMWDLFMTDPESLKNGCMVHYDTDPVLFWIGAERGQHVLCEYPAEDSVVMCEYRLVV
jgi:hypothetical protein